MYFYSLRPGNINRRLNINPEEDLDFIAYWKLGCFYNNYEKYHDFINDLKRYCKNFSNREETSVFNTNLLGSEFLKIFYISKDPLSLILKSHIILEKIVEQILNYKKINYKNKTFFEKIVLLKIYLSSDMFSDLFEFNRLRNSFSHRYNFNFGEYNMERFKLCKNLYCGMNIYDNEAKIGFNLHALEFVLDNLLGRLTMKFPFLHKVRKYNIE